MKKLEEMERPIASQLGKILADHFGRGPRSTRVMIRPPFVTIHLQDFLAPMEEVLLRQGDKRQVEELREKMMAEIVPCMSHVLKTEMNVDVLEVYYDWNFQPPRDCTGSIWAMIDVPDDEQESFSWPSAVSQKMVERQIETMSIRAQKQPETINCFCLHPRELLIERTGIFLEIERELMNYGHEKTLKVVKRPLEKRIFDRHVLESVLHATIQETFVDWHMEKDKGYLLIYLQPQRRGSHANE